MTEQAIEVEANEAVAESNVEVVDTSTEMAEVTERATTLPMPAAAFSTPALQRMAEESAALEIAFKMAQSLSKTTTVPLRYQQSHIPKGEREQLGIKAAYSLAAAILYGAELGMTALQSAQNVFDVHGQPAVYARTMVAQVRQWVDKRVVQGLVSDDPDVRDDVWEVSASATKVVWAGRRNGKTVSVEWTPDRADAAGFTRNEKYQKQPIEMLRAKAMTEVCRILFQDVLLGMAYSVEELQLEHGVTLQMVRPATGQKGVGGLADILAARKQQAAISAASATVEQHIEAQQSPEPEPVQEPPVEAEHPAEPAPEPSPTVEPISKRQLTEVKRLLAKETFTNTKSPETLAYVAQMVGLNELAALEDLTAVQADEIVMVLSQ